MAKQEDIWVRIDGQTHRLRPDNPESMRQIPWTQRKRLMDVLEVLKKAEYVDLETTSSENNPAVKTPGHQMSTPKAVNAQSSSRHTQQPPEHNHSSQDSDAMMQRFLAEQKSHKSSIPTKAGIYKWFLIIFAVIFLLVLLL